ncbi:MAG: apolipoprotein N-acyltransferase, partial [Alphaproteobacteria bacterium]
RRRFAALGLGVAAAASLPPVHALPLLWLAFPGLALLLARTSSVWSGFWVGWWFGCGYFLGGIYWLAWPFTLDIERFGWMIPFAVFGLSALQAIFVGGAAALTRATRLTGPAGIVMLAVSWAAFEFLRGHFGNVFAGFPWNLLAISWAAVDEMMQSAALFGAYGLSGVTVFIAAAPALLADRQLSRTARWVWIGAAVLLLAALWIGGAMRLAGANAEPVPGVRLRLVQGNIEQSLKWVEGRREQTFADYLRLTAAPGFDRITHVVWPETAIDYRFETDYTLARIEGERRRRLAAVIPPGGALLLGAIRDKAGRYYNSFHVVAPGGAVTATYDKHDLVPFGEFVPMRPVLRRLGVEKLAHGAGDYSAGPGPATLAVPGAPSTSPLICYEAIFPGHIDKTNRPGWLVNVTNDAWFGLTSGPYQHFASARLRAVEAGVPLVRAANTGITAVVDAYGRVTSRLPIMTTGALDAALPRATAEPTFYARLGDRSLLVLLVLGLGIALSSDMRQLARRTIDNRQAPGTI